MGAGGPAATKKKLASLLAIAFAIAAVATGLFYGLFADRLGTPKDAFPRHRIAVAAHPLERGATLKQDDMRIVEAAGAVTLQGVVTDPAQAAGKELIAPLSANSPILEAVLAAPGQADTGDVPSGMRAVTLHVAESGTLLPLLHNGSRIDIQAVADRSGPPELRRILQDVPVLGAQASEQNAGRGPAPTAITVLVPPELVDVLALADTAARIRIALRNGADRSAGAAPGRMQLASVFDGPAARPATLVNAVSTTPAAQVAAHAVERGATVKDETPSITAIVRVIAAGPDQLRLLANPAPDNSGLQVVALAGRPHVFENAPQLFGSRVSVGSGQATTVHAGSADCRLTVRLRLRHGLEITPELTWGDGESTRSAGVSVRVDPESAGFAITGFERAVAGAAGRAFPDRKVPGDLVVIIVPEHGQPEQAMLHR